MAFKVGLGASTMAIRAFREWGNGMIFNPCGSFPHSLNSNLKGIAIDEAPHPGGTLHHCTTSKISMIAARRPMNHVDQRINSWRNTPGT
jgi:hypothetical protein